MCSSDLLQIVATRMEAVERARARIAIGALKQGRVLHRLTWLTDGQEALQFLHHEGKYLSAPRPDLLLLDLKLPGLDGRELLAKIRDDEQLTSELYLKALGREPSTKEIATCVARGSGLRRKSVRNT